MLMIFVLGWYSVKHVIQWIIILVQTSVICLNLVLIVFSSYSEDEHNFVPTSYILPQTSSQYLGYEFCKNRVDITVVDLQKRGLDSWNPSPLKMPAIHDGGGEIGALRSKKNDHISSICSLPAGPRYKFGHHHFTDPFAGAPPEYIQRLSEIKSFQCETIRQEKNKKLKRGKKEETWTS
ncbi:C-C chemokine receptor type 4 [Platysternon megacephalum]|uniref:C-C chemokine receptor type 4 n=1 Tax=Platysternon megacephalum TaxID=55544 RepID=A0A4D9ECG6_9SAUR|nr:C-C chemokine receptor type 4 [Platysternon megacephalum]